MTLLEVAKYVRCFQKVHALQLAKSRMISREARYQDCVAELIRIVLPREYFQLLRLRHGYTLMFTGALDTVPHLSRTIQMPLFATLLHRVSLGVWRPSILVGEPTEELLDAAIAVRPTLLELTRIRQNLQPGDPIPVPEPEPVVPPITATPLTPPPRPESIAAEMAARVQGRPTLEREPVEEPETTELNNTRPDAVFMSPGARAFADALARANARRRT